MNDPCPYNLLDGGDCAGDCCICPVILEDWMNNSPEGRTKLLFCAEEEPQ